MKLQRNVQHDFGGAAMHYQNIAMLQQQVAGELLALKPDWGVCQGRLLDLGCGTGIVGQILHKQGFAGSLVQSDIAEAMCQQAFKNIEVSTIAADMQDLPFADRTFDLVTTSFSLHWVQQPELVFSEAYRVLRFGGAMMVAMPIAGTMTELHDAYNNIGMIPPVYRFLDGADCKHYAAQMGFKLCSTEIRQFVEYYENLRALMRQIKMLGARYKEQTAVPFMSKGRFAVLEDAYSDIAGDGGRLPLSWNMLFAVWEKR